MFCSKSGFSREEEFYLYDQEVGKGTNGVMKYNPLGYFARLAESRMQAENAFFLEGTTKELYERIVESLRMKMEQFDWESKKKGKICELPTLDNLEEAGMTHCPYQTQLPFNVDSFVESVRKCGFSVMFVCNVERIFLSGFGRVCWMMRGGRNDWRFFVGTICKRCTDATAHASHSRPKFQSWED